MYSYTYDDIARRYIDTVYRLALARTKSREHAEDVTQDVFLKLMQSKKQFEREEHLKAWLLRVTINHTKDLMMSSWLRKTDALDENIPAEDNEKSELYDAVMQLPVKYRTVIHLHYYEGYSIDEIVGIMKVKQGTVKAQLHRGREMLKNILRGEVI
ncbi:MAG: RNA polymerase sigma factor [Candidatus Ornithomonoglobus sp.]